MINRRDIEETRYEREARDEYRSRNSSPRHRDVELSTPVIAGCLVGLQLELFYEVT